jgi:hypothetical protein
MEAMELKEYLLNNIKNEKHYKFINNLKDIDEIFYFVWTFSKTGTSSLSKALQRLHKPNTSEYKNVLHCHNENCWNRSFNLNDNFDIFDVVKIQKKKPIIFQLYRNPVSRLVSEYFHLRSAYPTSVVPDLNEHLYNKIEPYYDYYEKKFDFKFSDIKYDKINKFCLIEKPGFYLFFVALEHFDKLKNNLINCFNSKGFCFDSFDIQKEHVNSYDKKIIKINDDIVETLFENNKAIIDFYYTEEEIEEFKNLYK